MSGTDTAHRARLLAWTRRALRTVARAIVTIAVVLGLWVGALWVLDVPPFVAKGPRDVWNHLFTGPASQENMAYVISQLRVTLLDALIGFSGGLGAALLLAAVFVLVHQVEHAFMPIALVLQSIPLIAIAPIIILIFGRGSATVAVISGLVVLFPALVTIVFGLRSTSHSMRELIQVFGGGRVAVLRKVALPTAVPALVAAMKIALPGALTGALIAEWLATGRGVGRAIVSAVGQAKMSEVWSLAVVVAATSVILYAIVSLIESAVALRMGLRRPED